MIRELDTVLAEVPLFADLPVTARQLLTGCAANVRFAEGAQLFRTGEPADSFYVIRHGTVALEMFLPSRGAMTIETLGAGEVLGWSWMFRPYRWHFDARALTTVLALGFDAACLREKCAADPSLGYALMERFAQVLIERLQWTRLRLMDVYGDVDLR